MASKQVRRFGATVSLAVAGGEQTALGAMSQTKPLITGESLSGVEPLSEHAGKMPGTI